MSDVAHFDPNPAGPKKGWFARNWLWFLPVVGLSSFCVCCLGCGGIFFGVMQTIKSSEAYQMALAHVQNDPEVRELLGEPIVEAGFMPLGQVNVNNGAGDAELYFQVSGPKGQASVSANALRENGQWELTYVEVTPDDGSSGPIVWPSDAAMEGPDVEIEFNGVTDPSLEDDSAVDDRTAEQEAEGAGTEAGDFESRDAAPDAP
jgi:hypothetical protein